MKTIKMKISNMHCRSCEMLIQDVLSDFEGIIKVNASYAKGTVEVEYDETKISPDRIKIVLKKEGYPAE